MCALKRPPRGVVNCLSDYQVPICIFLFLKLKIEPNIWLVIFSLDRWRGRFLLCRIWVAQRPPSNEVFQIWVQFKLEHCEVKISSEQHHV